MDIKLELKSVSCGYEKNQIVRDISFTISQGEVICLLGPNGVGKTTLFKAILGFLPLESGEVLLNGEKIERWSRKKLAGYIGYVPQAHEPPFPYRVLDVILMGRISHMKFFSNPGSEDILAAEEALNSIGIYHLRDRIYTEISGGERQMVLIARALAQNPKILIMDEPTSNLDFGNQIRVLEQVKALAERGFGVLMTSHAPDHAFLSATKVALMGRDHQFKLGATEEILSEEELFRTYGVNVMILNIESRNGKTVSACIPVLNS